MIQLYDRSTLIDRMIQAVRSQTSAITYFGPGPFRAFLYAVAGEVQQVYFKLFKVEQKLDLLVASGEDLDNHAEGRGLARLGGSSASVVIEIEADAEIDGTGTVSVTGTAVTGTGTSFAAEVAVGDTFIVGTSSALVSVVSGSSITLAASMPSVSGESFRIRKALITVPYDSESPLTFAGTSGSQFRATETLTLLPAYAGSSTLIGRLVARSVGSGPSQNVPAESIRTIVNKDLIPLVTATALNPAAAQGGREQESDAQLRTRMMTLFSGLNQGTAKFYEAHVRNIDPRVIRVFLARGGGLNEVLVHCLTMDGSPLTSQEKQDLASALGAVVPVHTVVTIRDMILQPVDISFTTTLVAGATVQGVADMLAAVYREYLDWSRWPFGVAVQADDLLRLASSTAGVDSLNIGSFTPDVDVTMPAATLPRVGTITVTDASGRTQSITGVRQIYPVLTD
jgi:uncharacterized phage protein gp47/JayE